MKVPSQLTEAIANLYPGVELIYSIGRQRFALIHYTPRGAKVLRILQDQLGGFVYPNDENTVGWLCASDHGDMNTEWKKREFERSMDEHKEKYDKAVMAQVSDFTKQELAPVLRRLILSGKLPRGA